MTQWNYIGVLDTVTTFVELLVDIAMEVFDDAMMEMMSLVCRDGSSFLQT